MRQIINSEKRIVQVTLSNVAVGDTAIVTIVNAQQSPTASNPTHVKVGTIVKAIYAEMWVMGAGQQPSTLTTLVMKNPGGDQNIDSTDMTNLNGYNQKNNIFELHQGLVGDANTNPAPFYRGWIKIPKGKQRMALGDLFQFAIKSITEGSQFCGFFIYKAYS